MFEKDSSDKGWYPKYMNNSYTSTTTKTKQPDWNIGKGDDQTFFQRRFTDGQLACEKRLNH